MTKRNKQVISTAEVYRLMNEHPNPVTRAVYRRIFMQRTQ